MAVDRLQLQVILDLADKASEPLKKIGGTSVELARKISEAEGALKKLQQQQQAIGRFRGMNQDVLAQGGKLRAAREELAAIAEKFKAAEAAGNQALAGTLKPQMEAAQKATNKLGKEYSANLDKVRNMRAALEKSGIKSAAVDEEKLAGKIKQVNDQLERQRPKLEAIARLNEKHKQQMVHVGVAAGVGYGALAAARTAARAGGSVLGAYSEQEDAGARLKSGLMRADGSVAPEYAQLMDLARSLGGELSGSTAEYTNMLAALQRQGMSTQVILDGAGKAAAYLAVQLQMPADEAAQLAVKLQKATRAAGGKDAMPIMDMMQRAHGMGVNPESLLGGVSGVAPALRYLHQRGAPAMQSVMPLLVQMEQSGVGGEAAGKGLRKAIAGSLNAAKLQKASQIAGFNLDFTDGKGRFGGIERMYGELAKIRRLSDARRAQVLRALYGDNPVVVAMMEKGITSYRQVADKLAAQADLEKRVQAQMKTFSHVWAVVTGAFKDVMASVGETVGDDLKDLAEWIGKAAARVSAWVRENPRLVRVLALVAAVIVGAVAAFGALALAFASVVGPMLVTRFVLGRFAVSLFGARAASWGLLPALRGLAGGIWGLTRAAIGFLFTPLGAALALLAVAAYLIWRNWDGIKGGLKAIWENLTECQSEFLQSPIKGLARLAMLPITVLEYIAGIGSVLLQNLASMKIPFISAGAEFIAGILEGIASKAKALKDGVIDIASKTAGWFKEKLGIASPSKVFMEFGGFISEGAALGIQRGAQLAQRAALALAAVTMAPMGMAATAMPALQSPAAGAGGGGARMAGGSTYSITINAQPGMDPQAIARAVRAELDRRERDRRSSVYSQMSDME